MSKPDSADNNLYAGYVEWKQWDGIFRTTESQARYYATQLEGLSLRGKRVFEIGFGNGAFLAWARMQGALISGNEINATLIGHGCEQGYDVSTTTLDTLVARGARYDLIIAFDVFEHWDTQELIDNIRHIAALLADDGVLLARFPNGHSPFGRVHQYGDFTHKSVLSKGKIHYLAQMSGLLVQAVGNACQVPSRPGWMSALRYWWRAKRRRRIESLIGKLYGTGRLPLDPNLVAVLRKPVANK